MNSVAGFSPEVNARSKTCIISWTAKTGVSAVPMLFITQLRGTCEPGSGEEGQTLSLGGTHCAS